MKPLTRQELFDNAAKGVIRQGRPSFDPHGTCLYFAGNSRCGIGHSIPDGHEGLYFRGDVKNLVFHYPDLAVLFDAGVNMDFLCDLQKAHDSSAVMTDFLTCFRGVMQNLAKNYKLNADSLDEDLTTSPKSV